MTGSVFSCLYLGVLIEVLQYFPSPVSVLGVLSESVHVEQTFYRLWSQKVVSVCRLEEKNHKRGEMTTSKSSDLMYDLRAENHS